MAAETVVVKSDIGVQDLVGVNAYLLHTLDHGNGAEVSEEWVINLNVSATSLVQVCDFFTIGLCNVGEITFFAVVGFLGEGVVTVTKMEPLRSSLRLT